MRNEELCEMRMRREIRKWMRNEKRNEEVDEARVGK